MFFKIYFHKQEFCQIIVMKREMLIKRDKWLAKGQDSDFLEKYSLQYCS